jgi:hypothetical protein
MNRHRLIRPGAWLAGFAWLIVLVPWAHGEEPGAMPAPDESYQSESMHRHRRGHHDQNSVVAIGHDALLAADRRADAVVAILGSATAEGEVADAVVSILGNTRVTGPVGDSAVAVLGNVYVDSRSTAMWSRYWAMSSSVPRRRLAAISWPSEAS